MLRVEGDFVLVDVGYKSEGMIPRNEWEDVDSPPEPGQSVRVLIEDIEDVSVLIDDSLIELTAVTVRLEMVDTGMVIQFLSLLHQIQTVQGMDQTAAGEIGVDVQPAEFCALCKGKRAELAVPVLLHLRRVIEDAGDFATAVRMLSEQRLAAPGLLTVVGRENDQRVVIERTSKHHGHRWGNGDKPLLATNHYRFLREPILGDSDVLDETSCDRFDALAGFFTEHTADQPVEEEALLYALTDPTVMQDITAQHVIIRPRTQEMRLFVPRRLMGS